MSKDPLIASIARLRADLMAERMLMDAVLTTQSPMGRAAVAEQFSRLSEASMAAGLNSTTDDEKVQNVQRAIDHVKQRLRGLPTAGG